MSKQDPKWRPKTHRRVFTKKDQALLWLLHLLQGGFFARTFSFLRRDADPLRVEAGEGAPEQIPEEVVRRAKARVGRPPARKKRGETRDEQIRRLNRERQARFRARKRQAKETER